MAASLVHARAATPTLPLYRRGARVSVYEFGVWLSLGAA